MIKEIQTRIMLNQVYIMKALVLIMSDEKRNADKSTASARLEIGIKDTIEMGKIITHQTSKL